MTKIACDLCRKIGGWREADAHPVVPAPTDDSRQVAELRAVDGHGLSGHCVNIAEQSQGQTGVGKIHHLAPGGFLAAASIGQVHRAKFHGRDIVLKIQYPGVAQSIDSDMKILRTVVDRLTPLFHGKKIDYSGLFQELTEVFKHETNYLREAKFTTQFRAFIKDVPHLRVPEVIPELSTERVLALGFEAGESLTTALKKPEFSEQVRLHYAKLFLDLYAREFLDWGVVQTDPNLGNFLIDLTTKDLVLLDFGAVREYPLEFRRQYRLVILAAARADRADCMVQLEKIGLLDPRESEATRDALFELISESMRPFHTESFDFKNDPYAENMRKLGIAFVRQVKFTPPPRDLIFLHRKLGGIFQVVKRLEVTMDLRPILKCFQDWQG
ncbi:MAG: AarF/ABC1/UbiB kinase family protein [Proteobacteria bacterium]|nr:MAG: AarF/ABC1/UbiB kinase family protein [Pseudomonadota bacterium]